MTAIRIVVADDHTVLRAGLAGLLDAEPDIQVVGQAADGLECIELAGELEPDIILMDINMPRCNGLEALTRIRRRYPDARVLVLTMHDDLGYLRQVLASGGAGYVLKQAAGDEVLAAIRAVYDGGVFIHPHHAVALAGDAHEAGEAAAAAAVAQQGESRARVEQLSEREAEVFRLVALGHSNGEIADMMYLSVKTIETYKSRLMKKLGLRTRAELVRFALEAGVLG